MLNKVDWMDSQTKLKALEKASTIISYIGFPQQLLNDSEIAKVYQNVSQRKKTILFYSYEEWYH